MNRKRAAGILTLPNILTASRIAAAPLLALAALTEQSPLLAAGLAAAAALTDLLDGAAARAMRRTSGLGSVLDPIADKVFILTALLLLIAAGTVRGAHLWAALILLWRETLIGGVRAYAQSIDLAASVSILSKLKTAAQFLAVIALFASRIPTAHADFLFDAGAGLLWAAACLALYTGADYVFRAWRRSWK